MIICFIYLIKILFSAKAILEFFQLFYLNFNLEQYVRKKVYIKSIEILIISAITSLKFNKTYSCWAHFIKNFDSFEFNQKNKFFYLHNSN